MRVINRTSFAFGPLMGRVRFPAHTATLVVKATFRLVPGGTCEALEEQPALAGDVLSEAEVPECLYDADLAVFKPQADMLLTGSCHAAGGKPVEACPVTFRVGQWSKSLACIGNRVWQKGLVFSKMGRTEPFNRMPITWANAFGGPKYKANPAGKGLKDGMLPNIENPAELISGAGNKPAPAGFGPIHRTWQQRTRKYGTYDQKWLKERFPALPADLDWTYFNAAPADQQLTGFLRGDEEIELTNLNPKHAALKTRLPGRRIRVLLREGTAASELKVREVPMNLDTLHVLADEEQAVLLWRGLAEVSDEDWLECRDILIVSEALADAPATIEQLQRLFEDEPEEVEAEFEVPPAADDFAAMFAEMEALDEKYTAQALAEAKRLAGGDADFAKLTAGPPASLEAATVAMTAALAALSPEHAAQLKGVNPAQFNPLNDPDFKELIKLGESMDKPPPPKGKALVAMLRSGEGKGGDYTAEDLTGEDLSGADLSEASFAEANLTGADLSSANLHGANLSGANLSNANLAGADLTEADLTEADLSAANLEGAKLAEASLRGCRAEGATFTGVQAMDARFSEVNAAGANFVAADLSGASFSEAQLTGANFTGAKLGGAELNQAIARDALFNEAEMENFRAEGGDFTGAKFVAAKADGSSLEAAILAGADLSHASLTTALLPFADLSGARLFGADLSRCNLRRAILKGAQAGNANFFQALLEKADLRDASLITSNFYEAELFEAVTDGADFDSANLKMTKLANA